MKRIYHLPLIAALALLAGGCQKQESEAERQAAIERQVQDRLAAERQSDAQANLEQRQAELDARERALASQENRPVATAAPVATATPAIRTSTPESDADSGSYATFYRKLDPYGDWMETGDYGYVFQPRQAASRDWRPYTHGHWVYTDAGWTWISEEKFGWATYHYGRWIRLRSVGWVWVPGEQWAPAWVSWRRGNDYVGWAPLPPEAQFNRQTGIQHWADNYYDIGPEQYAFVPANEFGRKLTPREIVPTERNVTIINQTTNVTNIVYNNSVIVDRGPSYEDLRARSRQTIQRFRLERTQNATEDRPVFRGEVVALPTIDFHPAERAARPNRIVRNIPQPVVERGWSGIKDTQAAEKARTKMKSEATPPANLPPKKFVRPKTPAATPAPPATTPAPRATATPSLPPVATPRPSRPGQKPRPTFSAWPTVAPSQTPAETARPSRPAASRAPSATPAPTVERKPRPTFSAPPATHRETATATPNETPAETARPTRPAANRPPSATPATPLEQVQPSPVENIPELNKADRVGRETPRAAQEEKRQARQEAQALRRAEREKKMAERRSQKTDPPATPPSATPGQTAEPSASPTDSASPSPDKSDRKSAAEKRADRRAQRKGGKSDASPTPEAE
ncbi:MAG: DUF6600 domain-containing protein [Chthoniobacterales bacterium]